MKAAWLETLGAALTVRELPDSVAGPGGVVVRVLAARVPSYTAAVLDGSLDFGLPLPFIPGGTCVGAVESVGEGVFDLAPGDVVLCNSLLESGDGENILISWFG